MNRITAAPFSLLLWIIILLVLFGRASKAHSQILTKITSGVVTHADPLPRKTSIFDTALFTADSAVRIGDAITTHRALSDPCHCYHEGDPIAPKGDGYGQITLFHYGALLALKSGHDLLASRGHPKLARWVYIADLVSESYTLGMNIHHLQMKH